MNGAAHEFAKRNDFSLYKSLKPVDKASLVNIKGTATPTNSSTVKIRTKNKFRPTNLGFDSNHYSDACKNADCYVHLYVLENELRDIIFSVFGKEISWWNEQNVPDSVLTSAKETIRRTQQYRWLPKYIRGKHPLFYVGLYDLFKILEKGSNWSKFKDFFGNDQEMLRVDIKKCVPIRHLIAHSIKTIDDYRNRVKLNVKDICTQIRNSAENDR